jgi:hypothetical protein
MSGAETPSSLAASVLPVRFQHIRNRDLKSLFNDALLRHHCLIDQIAQ